MKSYIIQSGLRYLVKSMRPLNMKRLPIPALSRVVQIALRCQFHSIQQVDCERRRLKGVSPPSQLRTLSSIIERLQRYRESIDPSGHPYFIDQVDLLHPGFYDPPWLPEGLHKRPRALAPMWAPWIRERPLASFSFAVAPFPDPPYLYSSKDDFLIKYMI